MIRTLISSGHQRRHGALRNVRARARPRAPGGSPPPRSSGAAAQTSADTSSDRPSGLSAAVLGYGYGFGTARPSTRMVSGSARALVTRSRCTSTSAATFIYHLGVVRPAASATTSCTSGVEVGYEIPAGPVMIRPYVGIGIVLGDGESRRLGRSASSVSSGIGLWPRRDGALSDTSSDRRRRRRALRHQQPRARRWTGISVSSTSTRFSISLTAQ